MTNRDTFADSKCGGWALDSDPSGNWRILVVEDDPDNASMIRKLIDRRFGAGVTVAGDCETARAMLADQRVDAVILDYQLPDGNGIQLLEEISGAENHPSVILVTGQGDEETAAEAFRLHASGYLVKDRRLPVMLPEVLSGALADISLKRAQEALLRSEEAERALLAEMEDRVIERTSELEKANEALRALAEQVQQQASMLDEILSASPDHFYLVDRSGRYIYASRAAAGALGLGQDDINGRYWWDLGFPAETMRALDIQRESVFSTGTPRTSEFQFPTSRGLRVFEYVMSPIHRPDGEVGTVVVTARDVTEQKEAAKALESYRARLEEQAQLLDLTHDTIMVRDMNSVILLWNRGCEEMYGWKREEALGRVSHQLLKTKFPGSLEAIEFELLRDGRWEGELIQTAREGRAVVVSSRWALKWAGGGQPEAILEIANEIAGR